MSAEEQALWDEATDQLRFHARPGHDWIATLNRLWRKNRFVMSLDGMLKLDVPPPVLTREMLTVSGERWPLDWLAPLVHVDAHARSRPKSDGRPILLLEWRDVDWAGRCVRSVLSASESKASTTGDRLESLGLNARRRTAKSRLISAFEASAFWRVATNSRSAALAIVVIFRCSRPAALERKILS